MAQHEIKTIVAELQSMSPRTQLEIVRLCKKVAELTPDYIDTLSAETKAELQPLIDANAAAIAANTNLINQEVTDRKAIVENVNNIIEGVSVNENKLKSSGTSEFAGVYVNDMLTSVTNENEAEITTPTFAINIDTQKAVMKSNTNDESVKIENHEVAITNNNHVLKLDASGNLTLDGNAVGGGGATLYQHNIKLSYNAGGTIYNVTLSYINNIRFDNSDATDLYSYLSSKNLTDTNHVISVSGIHRYTTNELHFINALYVSNNKFYFGYYDTTDGNYGFHYSSLSNFTLSDRVIQIS